jgi:hypothetical protein
MAQTVTQAEADAYFNANVVWSDEWDTATTTLKDKAITNAENQLYRTYKNYDITDATKQIDKKAIYEQALWLLRLDDTIRKAEQGAKQISISGIMISVDRVASYIAPEAIRIIGRRVGKSVL